MNNWSAFRSTNFLAYKYFAHNQPIRRKMANGGKNGESIFFFSSSALHNSRVGKRWSFVLFLSLTSLATRKRALTFSFFSSYFHRKSDISPVLIIIIISLQSLSLFNLSASKLRLIQSNRNIYVYIYIYEFKCLSLLVNFRYERKFPLRLFIPSFVSMNVLIKKYLARVHFSARQNQTKAGPTKSD